MAIWSVKPQFKKSIVEVQHWENGGESLTWTTVWRWGEFRVTTEDDNPPELPVGVDIYNCDYDAELYETTDGCYDEVNYDGCSDETREFIENFLEEGNSIFDLEEQGWYNSETEMIIDCDMDIELIEKTVDIEPEKEDNPQPKWPF